MCSNYFEKLIIKARQFDDDIEKLSNTWKLPQVIIERFAECTEETNSNIEALWNDINSTKRGINEILEETKKSEDSNDVGQFLQNTKNEYENLKQECNNLESVLAEYGYSQNDSLDKVNANSNGSPNQHLEEDIETLVVEFTPNLSWKCKKRR